jgi:hypothetical protein
MLGWGCHRRAYAFVSLIRVEILAIRHQRKAGYRS